jgi:hypothetical protein
MVDLIVPAGTTLVIDQNYAVAPKYGLFSMEAGAKIAVAVDLAIHADRAQFAANCVIDARGTPASTGPAMAGRAVRATTGSTSP